MSPRCLNKAAAAEYCGCTPEAFEKRIQRGLLPRAMPGTRSWDTKALDAALDKLSGIAPSIAVDGDDADTALQGWLAEHEG